MSRSAVNRRNTPPENRVQMRRYPVPMDKMPGLDVNSARKGRPAAQPSAANAAQHTSERNTPCVATASARACCPAPSARLRSTFSPTPMPVAMEIMNSCTGKHSETAFRASSLMRATNMLSTMLYSALMSMEAMTGRDMVSSSRPSGRAPILFSDMRAPPQGQASFLGNSLE